MYCKIGNYQKIILLTDAAKTTISQSPKKRMVAGAALYRLSPATMPDFTIVSACFLPIWGYCNSASSSPVIFEISAADMPACFILAAISSALSFAPFFSAVAMTLYMSRKFFKLSSYS